MLTIFSILQFSTIAVSADDTTPAFRLIFPSMQLNPKQYQAMEELNFTVACGHIESVARIPNLWNVEIVRVASAVEEFHAFAGLGTARLTKPKEWSGAIVIKQTDASCFKLSGSIIIGGEEYQEHSLSNANLRRASPK